MNLITVLTLIVCQSGSGSPKPDLSNPEKSIRVFTAAFVKLDLKTASSCVYGFSATNEMQGSMKQLVPAIQQNLVGPLVLKLGDVKAEITGDKASVIAHSKAANQPERIETIPLRKVGADWKIVAFDVKTMFGSKPPPLEEMQANPIRMLATTFALFPVFVEARERARAISCISNIKQVSMSAMMYASDHDEKLPSNAAAFKKDLMPFLKSEPVLHCPSDKSGAVSYSFNTNLQGIPTTKVKRPSETVLFYEGKGGIMDFRHSGSAVVAFVDGKAKLVTRQESKNLKWKPN